MILRKSSLTQSVNLFLAVTSVMHELMDLCGVYLSKTTSETLYLMQAVRALLSHFRHVKMELTLARSFGYLGPVPGLAPVSASIKSPWITQVRVVL